MVHITLIVTDLFVLTQMLKKQVALFTYQGKTKPFTGKRTYVNMKMVLKKSEGNC